MRTVITEQDVPRSGALHVTPGAIITPSARDLARERGVAIIETAAQQTIALGSDHGGFALKESLKPILTELGWHIRDVGVFEEKPADYPDIAHAVARLVADSAATLGVIVDGAGIGSCMAANKVPGIRAALCYDKASARNSREHNHANVLTLGAGMIGPNLAQQIVTLWLETPYGPDRHARRVEKIMQIEGRYLRK